MIKCIKNLFTLLLLVCFGASVVQAQVIINEFDADTPGTDAAEFVELAGVANAPLDGYILVLLNGNGDATYECYDLDGLTLDANGLFVIGNVASANLGPLDDATIKTSNWLQNGADAIALYNEAVCPTDGAACPGTLNLVDAVVYGTNDGDDTGLLTCLGETVQENDTQNESIQWDGAMWILNAPSPGAPNTGPVCSITNVSVSSLVCNGADFSFNVSFDAVNDSGTYEVYDSTNMVMLAASTSTFISVTIGGNTSTAPIDVYVRDQSDPMCISGVVTVTPLDCSFVPTCPAPGSLVITEIMATPDDISDANGEYIEVYNTSGTPVDLQGFYLRDNNSSHYIASSVIVPAMGYAVLASNIDNTMNGGFVGDYQYSGLSLSGEDIVLLECDSVVIDSVNYNLIGGFPEPIGASMSLNAAVLDAASNDDGANWCSSPSSTLTSTDLGTPGVANDMCLSLECANPGDLIITEIMHTPTTISGEYIEIYNTTATDIDLINYILRDDGTDNITIDANVIVPAGGYAVLARNGDPAVNGGFTPDYVYSSYAISTSDEVVLECDGVVIDRVDYSGALGFPSANTSSLSLDPGSFDQTSNDVGGNWCASTSPLATGDTGTPGAANDTCDTDMDGIFDALDNCPAMANPGQEDADMDGVGDVCDNCPSDANPGQEDADMNGVGDICEVVGCPDTLYVPGVIATGLYEAALNVNSDGATAPGSVVTFRAGVDIDLNPDFEVLGGAEFEAIIGPCPAPAVREENEEQK